MRDQLNFEIRNDFPAFLNKCGLVGTGGKIGVQEGAFSEYILRNWKGSALFSIDAWQNFDADEYVDICNLSDDELILQRPFYRMADDLRTGCLGHAQQHIGFLLHRRGSQL